MDSEITSFRILMFPWLAHGHIFPYLELAKRILKRKNFHIYLCSTAINFSSIKNFIEKNLLDDSIDLVELHLKPFPELPPHYHTTKNLPSNLIMTLLKAFQTAKSSFSDIISTLKPDLVIYDIYQPWAATLASFQGIPSVHFATFGAAMMSYVHHHYACWDDDFPFPKLCLQSHEKKGVDDLIEFLYDNVFEEDKDVLFVNYKLSSDIVLLKTSRAFEGKYIDCISAFCKKELLTVGPLVADANKNDEGNSEILQWLSKKKPNSTVFVSFGSEYFLSKDEINEIAKGLELCDVNFIWIIRFPVGEEKNSREKALPQGFLDRVKDRGIVVSGWAPQANILSHPSTGGFISHCGWSSITESMYFGVPVIAMAMKYDQPMNARMLGEAGFCAEVPRDENEMFKGEEIARVINEVIVEKSGVGLRHRVQELSEEMRMEEEQALDEIAEQLWQICLKDKLNSES